MSSYVVHMFYATNSPKPKDILFILMYDKEKDQTLT